MPTAAIHEHPSNAFIVDIRRHPRWNEAPPHIPPQGWAVGLLAKAPDPDGVGYEELDVEGYGRITLSLAPRNELSTATLANLNLVQFGPVTRYWPVKVWAAVFDTHKTLVGYRYLQPWGSSKFAGEINIRPFDLTITF